MDSRNSSEAISERFEGLKTVFYVIPLIKRYIRALCVWGAALEPLIFSGK